MLCACSCDQRRILYPCPCLELWAEVAAVSHHCGTKQLNHSFWKTSIGYPGINVQWNVLVLMFVSRKISRKQKNDSPDFIVPVLYICWRWRYVHHKTRTISICYWSFVYNTNRPLWWPHLNVRELKFGRSTPRSAGRSSGQD